MKAPDLRIHITAKDIREGEPRDPGLCPVARATRRAIGRVLGIDDVDVCITAEVVAHFHENDWCVRLWWGTSSALHEWINRFDFGLPVKPASFILKGESQWNRKPSS